MRQSACLAINTIMVDKFALLSTDDLLLLQIFSGVVWQTRDLHLSRNSLYLLSPRLCFFIELTRDLFVYLDDPLAS